MAGDNVEVVYDHVTGQPTNNTQQQQQQRSKSPKPPHTSNHGNAPYVDFENVFDPFERDDDVREFFEDDDTDNPNRRDTDLDVENPVPCFSRPQGTSKKKYCGKHCCCIVLL